MIVALATTKVNAISQTSSVTGIYICQGKACDPHSHRSLSKMLRVTNAIVWEGEMFGDAIMCLSRMGFIGSTKNQWNVFKLVPNVVTNA